MICCLAVGAAVVAAGGIAATTKRRRSAEAQTLSAASLPAAAEGFEGDVRKPEAAREEAGDGGKRRSDGVPEC